MKEQASYPKTDAKFKKGSGKDASAYKSETGGIGGKMQKGHSRMDSAGEVKKKDDSAYKSGLTKGEQ
jgi:hypothetical protein